MSRGKHVTPWKLNNELVNRFGGKKTYESVSYLSDGERYSAYCYLQKLNKFVRISDHTHPDESRKFDVEIILSYFNYDFTINGVYYPQQPDDNKGTTMARIIDILAKYKVQACRCKSGHLNFQDSVSQ